MPTPSYDTGMVARRAVQITPGASDLPDGPAVVRANSGGDMTFLDTVGTTITWTLAAGEVVPCMAVRVTTWSGTAGALWALY